MKAAVSQSSNNFHQYQQIEVSSVTMHHRGIRAAETREPIRVVVLRALKAYGVTVSDEAISDRRKRRPA
jgi:hypothetical protein